MQAHLLWPSGREHARLAAGRRVAARLGEAIHDIAKLRLEAWRQGGRGGAKWVRVIPLKGALCT